VERCAVLLVEDNDGDAALFTALLGAVEPTWRWERVATLAAARPRLGSDTFDCILADLDLPDGDGLEVLDQLREMAGSAVPILALTSRQDETLAVEAVQRAAEDYLLKVEFDPAHIVRSIRYAIERTEIRQQIERRERRFSALASALTEGILVQDSLGRIVEANEAAARILDVSLTELVTDPPRFGWYRAVAPDGTPLAPGSGPGRVALETNEPQIDVVFGVVRRTGPTVWLEVNAIPVREAPPVPGDDSPDIVVISFRDITARRAVEAELRLRTSLLDAAGQAIIATDVDFEVIYWNTAAEKLYGWPATEVLGQDLPQLIGTTEAHVAESRELLRSALRPGSTWTGEVAVRRRDGSTFPALASYTALFDEAAGIVAIIGVSTDLSARKAAEESRAFLSAIVESSNDAIIGLDLAGTITNWNRSAQRMYGYAPDEAVGRPESILVPDELLGESRAMLDRARSGEPSSNIETRRRTRSGGVVDVEQSVVAVRNPEREIIGLSVISHDITVRVRRAREAEQKQRELAEAKELADRRELDRQAAERANEAKNEFLSRMSHELRTPLNAVLGFAQLLLRDDLSERTRDYSDHIYRAGSHLLDLINEVLDISRIESGVIPLSIEPMLVCEVVDDAADLSRPLAASRDIVITVHPSDPHLAVLADRQRVVQVLLNLLNNATKYNASNGRVDIEMGQLDAGTVRISVRDTGPGIRPEHLDRLFTPFDRLGAERTDVEGAGVGLALSHALSAAMGGTLSVESTLGQGSTFHCDLPTGSVVEHEADDKGASLAHEPVRTLRVLYIEDNLLSRHLVQRALESAGEVEMLFAMQGRLGIELARHHHPHLVLLDLHLPDMHGSDVVRELQSDPTTRDIPIVVLSADATPSQRVLLERLGARHYLTKPLDLAELDEVINEFAVPFDPAP